MFNRPNSYYQTPHRAPNVQDRRFQQVLTRGIENVACIQKLTFGPYCMTDSQEWIQFK